MKRPSLIFSASVGKIIRDPYNEDVAVADPRRGIFAVADGATQSYDPRTWARQIANDFLKHGRINPAIITGNTVRYRSGIDYDALPWNEQGALDRGSFTTLAGIRIKLDQVDVTVIGDSLAVLVDETIIDTIPYSDPKSFRNNPQLLSTIPRHNTIFGDFSKQQHQWNLTPLHDPLILLMTDALGQWLLSRPSRIHMLTTLKTKARFAVLVESERSKKTLRRDDTTLMIIRP